MKTKLVATATLLCVLALNSLTHAETVPAPQPEYTSPGIGTLVMYWLFGK